MIPFSDKAVAQVFESYPPEVAPRMHALRDLIFTTAESQNYSLTETLKWGEPSYRCSQGSPLRIHWKENDPLHYRMFFHCQTKLISTFRILYPDDFDFEGNRALRFSIDQDPNLEPLTKCVQIALNYHSIKNLECGAWHRFG